MNRSQERKVNKLMALLVRHSNRCDLLQNINLEILGRHLGIRNYRRVIEREEKSYRDTLLNADTRLLLTADGRLMERERSMCR
jgi:hypothetical protein